MVDSLASWVVTGAVTGVLAPGLLLASRHRRWWVRVKPHPVPTALGFVCVHGAITISLVAGFDLPAWLALHVTLLAASVAYWLPLWRLDGVGQFLYLFLTSPLLDLAGVVVVALGQPTHGLGMIVGMLPLNAVALVVTWRWLAEEERMPTGTGGGPSLPGGLP